MMMKFRVFNKENGVMEYEPPRYSITGEGLLLLDGEIVHGSREVMYNTGLMSIRRVPIYESDIIKTFNKCVPHQPILGLMAWDEKKMAFGLVDWKSGLWLGSSYIPTENLSVRGNLWENPELLSEPKK